MPEPEENIEIVNEKGEVLGLARRSEVHGNPSMIHRVVHVLVFNERGGLLLQKRSINKEVAPGQWDTSVGGHVGEGEELTLSAIREMREELGIESGQIEYLYSYIHRNPYEAELVTTFCCTYSGDIIFNADEIDEVRFWSLAEIKEALGKSIFSEYFEDEIRMYLKFTRCED